MKLEGVCKVYSALGVEYQFGEFYIDRDYLVFDQNYSLAMKKRQTFPVAKLHHIKLISNGNGAHLTFSCDNIEFEVNDDAQGNLLTFRDLLQNKCLSQIAINNIESSSESGYTTHHYHVFAQS